MRWAVTPSASPQSFRSGRVLVLLMLLLTCGGCRPQSVPKQPTSISDSIETTPAVTENVTAKNPGYVGIDRCEPCHRERVGEFRETRHFLAAVDATQVKMAAGFEPGRNRFQAPLSQLTFEMSDNDHAPQMTVWNTTNPASTRRETPIDIVYGYGADTDETYFRWRDDRVHELPVAWMHSHQCWGGVVINPHGGGDYSRPVTAQCLNCHFTWVDCVPGESPLFRRETALLGVTCERCHGPGRDHVAHHEKAPADRTPQSIVPPSQLSRERLLDLCAQCHDNGIQFRRAPFTYRPGDVLSEFVRIPQFPLEEDNHVANQNGGMQASRCFQQSESMTCITCHDPHHRRTSENAGAKSCSACHQAADCREQPRLPEAVRGDCISCHMPIRNKVQVNFRTQKDGYVPPARRWEHRIAIYPAARDRVLRDWFQAQPDADSQARAAELTQSLAEYWLQQARQYEEHTRFLMAIDAYREAEQVVPSAETTAHIQRLVQKQTEIDTDWFRSMHLIDQGRHREAIPLIESLLEVQPRMARARGRLGTLYAATGNRTRGIQSLRMATELDPNDSYSFGMLGWLAYLDGQFDEALRWFTQASERDARGPKVHYQLGLTLVALEKRDDARKVFQYVLELNPAALDACRALIQLDQDAANHQGAIDWARRAVQITQERDPDLWFLLSECYTQGGQPAEAKQAVERVLKIAEEQKNASLIRRAKGRMESLRAR